MSSEGSKVINTKMKRRRAVNVCVNCKIRKIKCDKKNPCSKCVQSNKVCEYQIDDSIDQNINSVLQDCTMKGLKAHTILDEKIDGFQLVSIRKNNSVWECYSDPLEASTIQYFDDFKRILLDERPSWKHSNNKPIPSLSEIPISNPEELQIIIDEINTYVTPFYFAIIERIRYFQIFLNELVFGSSVPCDTLFTIVHTYFQHENGIITFLPPVKRYQYQYIALMLTIVDISVTFTENTVTDYFKNSISSNDNILAHIGLKCIRYSNIEKKQTIYGVYSILATRLALCVYCSNLDPEMENKNSYPLYQKAVNIALNIGVHRAGTFVEIQNLTKVEMEEDLFFTSPISDFYVKKLWNYILNIDTDYSLRGTPPYINIEYCHAYHADICTDFKTEAQLNNISIKVVELLYSVAPVSYNKLFECCENLKEFCDKFDSFDKLVDGKTVKSDWFKLKRKLEVLKLISLCASFGITLTTEKSLARYFTEKQMRETENKLLIDEFNIYMKQTFFLSYILMSKIIIQCIKAEFPELFFIYMQPFMKEWYTKFTIIALEDIRWNSDNFEMSETVLEVTLREVEEALLGKTIDRDQFHSIMRYVINSKTVLTNNCTVCSYLSGLTCLNSDFNFTFSLKVCWILSCFLKSTRDVINNKSFLEAEVKMKKILELTKSELLLSNSNHLTVKYEESTFQHVNCITCSDEEIEALLQYFRQLNPPFLPPRDFETYFGHSPSNSVDI